MTRRLLVAFAALTIAAASLLTLLFLSIDSPAAPDAVAVNSLRKRIEAGWESGAALERLETPFDYTVVDEKGAVVFQSRPGLSVSVHEALLNRETPLDLTAAGRYAGQLIVHNDQHEAFALWKKRLVQITAATAGFLLALGAVYILYIQRRIFRPFKRMQRFARHIAKGDFDLPLEMDRDNLFGAFTESFDMMREELAAARRNEYLAEKSKKELVAGLSHDIKTPVASIKAIAELMLVQVADERAERRLETLYAKADQIDRLVTDMFHSTLEELDELRVSLREEPSTVLTAMIASADYTDTVLTGPVPDCFLYIDPLRLQQVIDNVIHNARKYAGGKMNVSFAVRGPFLQAEFADYGPGVPEEELSLLFHKYYRGSASSGQSGTGLGLYLSRHLMKRMKGGIEAYNRRDGFSVMVLLPLSGKVQEAN